MIGSGYLQGKSSPPSAAKRFLDQRVLPVAIDTAGGVEGLLELLAARIRLRPLGMSALALGAGFLLSALAPPRRSRRW